MHQSHRRILLCVFADVHKDIREDVGIVGGCYAARQISPNVKWVEKVILATLGETKEDVGTACSLFLDKPGW